MKVKCERTKLLEAFQTVASVVPSRSPKPVLQNVKLEASADAAILMATDLEVGIRAVVPGVEVEVPGSALLPLSQFGPILRESPDETLFLEADPQGTLVRGERSQFNLAGANPDEFPSVAAFTESAYHEVPARFLREVIRRTVFATDTESSRYALGGVLFELDKDKLTAVGTDGRRLAKMEGPALSVGGQETGDQTTIVPTKALTLIERALSDADAEIQMAVQPNNVLVQSQRVTVFSRLVEGRFPKWREVLPQRSDFHAIDIPVGAFLSAVRQAAVVTSQESRGIDFTFGSGSVVLAAQTAEIGQSRIEMPIAFDGEPITTVLDPRYMSDFLKVLDPEKTFRLEVKDSESAVVTSTDDGYAYVIMPMTRDR
ncbi:MAG: DNA polymerase III subunit beta [Planctomycetota bacterium]|nr:MAG: DNA polymerase III subunit beta [Planctomycetota bacterium]REJ97098.1 MAG: DNA polymerase III subunit beta [Planctomycetota bacterium]REK22482.1 MAG: DNA polymerase III subunit beta [Planctomycetota bacterium]REK47124.1 MAG: DNA polymerase III subunit beta [Planctomycetota bacterium]